MDSNLSTSAYYSEDDSIPSSSQEDISKNNTTGYKLKLSLSNRETPNDAQEGAVRRASADTTTKSKDPTNDIVDRILAQIESRLREASPHYRKPWRRHNAPEQRDVSDNDTVEAVYPDTGDENNQSEKPATQPRRSRANTIQNGAQSQDQRSTVTFAHLIHPAALTQNISRSHA